MMKDYQKDENYQKQFKEQVEKLQLQGFKPLTPFFDNYSEEQLGDFLYKKKLRNEKRNLDFGLSPSTSEEVLSLNDDVILDPAFAAILNEDREIVVENKLYKYTDFGLFMCDKNRRGDLIKYLDSLTPAERNNYPKNQKSSTSRGLFIDMSFLSYFSFNLNFDFSSGLLIALYPPPPPPVAVPIKSLTTPAELVKQNLPTCWTRGENIWEWIFGPSKSCSAFMDDGRCCVTKFWNQNYFLFSSIGCSANFEKKNQINFFWGGSITWWDKSYADEIELGVNNIAFEYTYNVPAFNQDAFNYSTTFFTYENVNYNVHGNVIPNVPTGHGNFIFDTDSNNSKLNITILGYHLTSGDYNRAIDEAALVLYNKANQERNIQEMKRKKDEGKLTINVINAVPFSNTVKMITTGAKWNGRGVSSRVKYFDLNFVFTFDSTKNTVLGILKGLIGATTYSNVEADIYGAALWKNKWNGSRMIYKGRR